MAAWTRKNNVKCGEAAEKLECACAAGKMAARPGKAVSFFKLKIHLPYDQQSHSCVFTWEKWKCIFTKILAWGCSITARLHQVLKLESSSGARGRGTTGGTQRDNRPAEPSVRGEICQHTRRCGWVSEAGHKRCAHCGPFTKSPSVEKPTWRKNESGRHRIKGWFRGGEHWEQCGELSGRKECSVSS